MTRLPVTSLDFRMPGYRDAKPEDYEWADNGELARKDRWETTIRSIAYAIRAHDPWLLAVERSCPDVVDAVVKLIESREQLWRSMPTPAGDLQQLHAVLSGAASPVPGDGYRLLKPGELIVDGDEYEGFMGWEPYKRSSGSAFHSQMQPTRRKISPSDIVPPYRELESGERICFADEFLSPITGKWVSHVMHVGASWELHVHAQTRRLVQPLPLNMRAE